MKSIQKPQVWDLSRLCPETSTKLYVHEFGFWDKVRGCIQRETWVKGPYAGAYYNLTLIECFPNYSKMKNGTTKRLTMELSELRQDVQMSRCCMLVSRSGKETKSPLGKEPTLLTFYTKCVSLWFSFQFDIRVQLAADQEKWFLLCSRRTVTCLITQLTGC